MKQANKSIDNRIRLCSLENNAFKDIKEISLDSLNSIEKDIEIINEYNNHFLIYVYFQQNLIEFDEFCKTLENIPVTSVNLDVLFSGQDFIKANRIVFNLLTSFMFFVASSEKYIKGRFGKESNETKGFKSLTNNYFDNYFSYRFLVKLRNYTVHAGFPINLIPFNAGEDYENPEKMVGSKKLIIDREEILKEKSYLKARVTQDLERMTEDIDVIPLIYELGKIIFKIEKYIYSLHLPDLEESISNLKMFAQKYKTDNNEVSIIYNLTQTGRKASIKALTIPFNKIAEIEHFKNWKI